MSKAGMAVLAVFVMGAMAAFAGIAARSVPVLQGAVQGTSPAGASLMNGSHPLLPPAKLRLTGEVTPLAAGDVLQAVNPLLIEQARATADSSARSGTNRDSLAIALGCRSNRSSGKSANKTSADTAHPVTVFSDGLINSGATTQANDNGYCQCGGTHHTGAKHSSPLHLLGPLSSLIPASKLNRRARQDIQMAFILTAQFRRPG